MSITTDFDFDKVNSVLWKCKHCKIIGDRFWKIKHICVRKENDRNNRNSI